MSVASMSGYLQTVIPSTVPTVSPNIGGVIPAWNIVANTSQDNIIVDNLPVGFYTLQWQGQAQYLTGAKASLISVGVLLGAGGALLPVKYPVINLTNIPATSTNDVYLTGGSFSFYNQVVQDLSFFRSASADFTNGATPAQIVFSNYTLVKQNYIS
jgi:hypothetical protein